MNLRSVQLITVSRQYGAGGSELASFLGTRLGWPVLDHDIVQRVAQRLRLDEQTVDQLDEHPPSLLARIASVLIIAQPEAIALPPSDLTSPDTIARATREVIEELAGELPLIIVGHGAQCIFAEHDGSLHVRVTASTDTRIERLRDRFNVDRATAGTMLRQADTDREAYVRRYFHRDVHDDLLYDLRINTGRVTIAQAATIVMQLVAERDLDKTATTTQRSA
jgi:cytidylate kinase